MIGVLILAGAFYIALMVLGFMCLRYVAEVGERQAQQTQEFGRTITTTITNLIVSNGEIQREAAKQYTNSIDSLIERVQGPTPDTQRALWSQALTAPAPPLEAWHEFDEQFTDDLAGYDQGDD